ncbi:adenylosuccinate lyase [Entomoplasma ellychniae]|uniref:Adenylosuccinate lyase n=1 Tax=Entomoplasma ellychniae TaxID=2114 RepID=A0A8E2QZF3_9MOLU|nr:adenylosuccinate lyase [Entomoplasma ellychniae]PPE05003.1 adenylosuccinate lyase [Entomoplasma ellychniae]
MIKRYRVSSIQKIWDEENRIQKWWEVELEVIKAWNILGVVPQNDLDIIIKKVNLSLSRMLEIEKETKHDVVAFTRMISESLNEEAKWVHLGITSTDVVDTAQNLQIKESSLIVLESLNALSLTIFNLAIKHKKTLIMGRSHGIYGEPTSLGLKFLLWHAELSRQIKRVTLAFEDVCVTKVSGSMGNFANLEVEVENIVAKNLQMPVDLISTQVSQRDRLASLFLSFANLASTFEKIATEIRLYQRSEVKEILEGFSINQKGSSSMPHKKNPISSENISGLSRMIKSYVIPALENNVLWHERDISHSSNERIMLPDVFNLITYISNRLNSVLINIVIDEKQMLRNIQLANNVFYSQPILTEAIKHSNNKREEIYDLIQKASLVALQENKDFIEVIKTYNISKFISEDKMKEILTLDYFLRNVDEIYLRYNEQK